MYEFFKGVKMKSPLFRSVAMTDQWPDTKC